MSKMTEQVNGNHLGDTKSNGKSAHAEDIQRVAYIRLSNRVSILVGSTGTAFQVPQDLLSQHSPILGEKCRSTSARGVIELPKVKASTFEDFFIWLHVFEPRLGTKSFEALLELAVFAETYSIYHLKNQTSDLIRWGFDDKQWDMTPNLFSRVYNSVPSGSALRQLWVFVFVITNVRAASSEQDNDYSKWKPAFDKYPGLGWDYFLQMQNVQPRPESVTPGGACSFHDHSDIPSWERQFTAECPYPHGAPAKLPESDRPMKNTTQTAEVEETNGSVVLEVLSTPEAALDSEAVPKEPAAVSKKDKKKKNKKQKETKEVDIGILLDGISVSSG
ncbi:hypothetical protein LOCC1_G007216 [Lachnellula occidentalis]|uniref:BTB domain-containing protein n=1 Tax=Lachnellula occidentalis TaxID=215460 RepID=A0A8H8S2G3_9HELO|nr:hypothetical protein LOCC1_G007216 [Lachnellula occidentalis]